MSGALLLSALLLGLLGSTHCVAMCGGVVAMSCSALPLVRRRRVLAQLPYVLSYNAGRIASYAAAGAAAGALGTTLQSMGAVQNTTLALRLLAGLTMLAAGLYLAGFVRTLAWAERAGAPLWRRLLPLGRALLPVRAPPQAFALGLLWGWMPCGLVYAALLAAVTSGSAARGALAMAAFGVGTLPMLVGLGSAAAFLARVARGRRARLAAALVVGTFGVVQIGDAGLAWASASRTPPCCAGHAPPRVAAR